MFWGRKPNFVEAGEYIWRDPSLEIFCVLKQEKKDMQNDKYALPQHKIMPLLCGVCVCAHTCVLWMCAHMSVYMLTEDKGWSQVSCYITVHLIFLGYSVNWIWNSLFWLGWLSRICLSMPLSTQIMTYAAIPGLVWFGCVCLVALFVLFLTRVLGIRTCDLVLTKQELLALSPASTQRLDV